MGPCVTADCQIVGDATMAGDADAAERYRKRATELRAIADGTIDPKSRKVLQIIADDYDYMARMRECIEQTERVLGSANSTRRK